MFNNITTKKKLLSFPILFVLVIAILAGVFNHFNNIVNERVSFSSQTDVFIQQVLKGRISVYQFLRSPGENKADKVRDDFKALIVKVNALKPNLDSKDDKQLCDEITKLSTVYIKYFDQFADKRIKDFQNGIKKESAQIGTIIKQMAQTGIILEEKLSKINQNSIKAKTNSQQTLSTVIAIISITAIILFLMFSLSVAKNISNSLNNFEKGLNGFFAYLNKQSTNVEPLNDKANDEFGQMAKIVNENIVKTKKGIEEDNILIDEAKDVMSKVKNGCYSVNIEKTTANSSLEEFKNNVNEMIVATKAHFLSINSVLEEYVNYNYTNKLQVSDKKDGGVFDKLAKDINHLQSSITHMLVDNKRNGLKLDESSNILLENVDLLNKNSNESAAALEETAAALEEITSNISSTTENVVAMSNYASQLTVSANSGQELASKTTTAMDEINSEVRAINEAIAVIDQIAFQTNILSLNAAVEAATAGEAGKGFAVVAGEVRNLASRSAEAANEIKTLVENATSKANNGKDIADKMIEGYTGLNKNITKTIELISDVENASKEQQAGIIQINDAINSLDKQTQENANIASQAHSVAVQTDEIAKLVVQNADEKEFEGKNSISI